MLLKLEVKTSPLAIAAEAVHAIKWQLQHRYMQIEGMAELDASAEASPSLIAEADAA